FSMRDLSAALQRLTPFDQIQSYIGHYTRDNPLAVKTQINEFVDGYPGMFYVVGTNHEWIIRLFVKYGGDVNATYGTPPIPLLAFAILNSRTIEWDTSATVATLLSLGANANVIPKAFYVPFCKDLEGNGPIEDDLKADWDDEEKRWCQSLDMRIGLAETLNLTQRYHLEKSMRLVKPMERQKQVAQINNSEELLGIPYFLIGQGVATESLTKYLLQSMLRNSRDPLVLVFAGPSGHGKTELAGRLGALLSLEIHTADCTIVQREMELFGPRKPYNGAEQGSPLNNFLARKNGEKCIVFLDEFEKTTSDIWNALLIPFDKGEYEDRRNLTRIDCSKTIWILATNQLDGRITEFCKKNSKIFDEDDLETRDDLIDELKEQMKDGFVEHFQPPLTGRISAFIPFLPFSFLEQCVGAHKYVIELMNDVRLPVNMSPKGRRQLMGNIKLRVPLDATVCRHLADGYDAKLGIRSLK
ncbi:P-loop containing nucleoside triphosphate hydrolase protein, partial [Tricladium varicosporioides]